MHPYFYKIQEITTGKYYVGCQYGKKSNPSNLWQTYFTSNKYINTQPKENFKIIKVICRDDAREYERRYLKKCYGIFKKEKFLKILINRNIAPGILNTPESIAKGNEKRKISCVKPALERIKNGTHNFLTNRYVHTEEDRKNASLRMMGNQYGKLVNRDEEFRKKQAEGAKGNTNVRGTVWVINSDGKMKRVAPDKIPDGYALKRKTSK